MEKGTYPNWIEINLDAIEHNVRYLLSKTQRPLLAVVKADAYGHGAVEVGKAALRAGASWLGVARYGEAKVLRQAGISAPILVLGMATAAEVDEAIKNDVTLNMHSFEAAEVYSQRGKAAGKPVQVHLKVNTGMNRLGVLPTEAVALAKRANELGGIHIDGMFSHYANANTPNDPFTPEQTRRFKVAVDAMTQAGLLPKWVHLANSAGSYFEPDGYFNMTRAGSAVTGLAFRDNEPYPAVMRHAFEWKVLLAQCSPVAKGQSIGYSQTYTLEKDGYIGTLPVGYGDGYRRKMGNHVLIGGTRVPVVGSECMDQMMILLDKPYPVGTEVVLVGTQGKESIFVEDLCLVWKTIEVDLTTNVNFRVPRVYVRD
jgi:alanine racemase